MLSNEIPTLASLEYLDAGVQWT